MGIQLTLPIPPSANQIWRNYRGRVVLSDEALTFRQEVNAICHPKDLTPLDGMVRVTVKVYRPRSAGDLDNSLKALLDALKGKAFYDDAQVYEIHAFKYIDKKNPRVEVTVEAMEKP